MHVTGRTILAAAAAAALLALPVRAATIVTDATITDTVPGIATFQTTGADMSGMEVTLNFATGGSESATWQTTGPGAGGAFGTGWSVAVSGDTFLADWDVDFGTLFVESMVLDGRNGLTLFDLTFDNTAGTPGSELGRDFVSDLTDDNAVTATYSRQVGIGAVDPVGDIWHVLSVDFSLVNNGAGATRQFTFLQDTDNDIRRPPSQVPAPAGFAVLGVALAGLAFGRRHRT